MINTAGKYLQFSYYTNEKMREGHIFEIIRELQLTAYNECDYHWVLTSTAIGYYQVHVGLAPFDRF
jgi:hypothetical protein